MLQYGPTRAVSHIDIGRSLDAGGGFGPRRRFLTCCRFLTCRRGGFGPHRRTFRCRRVSHCRCGSLRCESCCGTAPPAPFGSLLSSWGLTRAGEPAPRDGGSLASALGVVAGEVLARTDVLVVAIKGAFVGAGVFGESRGGAAPPAPVRFLLSRPYLTRVGS